MPTSTQNTKPSRLHIFSLSSLEYHATSFCRSPPTLSLRTSAQFFLYLLVASRQRHLEWFIRLPETLLTAAVWWPHFYYLDFMFTLYTTLIVTFYRLQTTIRPPWPLHHTDLKLYWPLLLHQLDLDHYDRTSDNPFDSTFDL